MQRRSDNEVKKNAVQRGEGEGEEKQAKVRERPAGEKGGDPPFISPGRRVG